MQDVLFDTKNHTIYTPNTNQTVKFGEFSIDKQNQNGIMETRRNDGSNYTKDEHGRFTGSTSSGSGGSGKLTQAEETAVNTYISSESYVINEKLRSGIPLTAEEQKTVDNLDSALEKMPKYEGTVYRSLSSDMMNNSKEFWQLHQVGNTVQYKAYTSSSLEVYDETMDIQCVIKSKRGRNITSHNDNEKEILFQRNSLFFVTGIKSHTIYMEEV